MSKQNWQQIYARGEQLNRYPYDFIVANYFHYLRTYDGQVLKVLDLGCGGGNHSLFCAENGAQVLAVDYSLSALDTVNRRAAEQGLGERITTAQVDFEDFSLSVSGIDLVIDRLSVSHAPRHCAKQVYDAVYQMLNPGGVILSNVFSTGHSDKDFGRYDDKLDTWVDFNGGIFEHLHAASFYSEQEVRQLFNLYRVNSLSCETQRELTSTNECFEIWKIIAQK